MSDVVVLAEKEILDHLKSLKSTLFQNKIKLFESYDEQLTEENVRSKSLQTPAIFVLYRGSDEASEIEFNKLYLTRMQFLLACVSSNVASRDSKKSEIYWIVSRVKEAFRGMQTTIAGREFKIAVVGDRLEVTSKNLTVFSVSIIVEGYWGEDGAGPS